MTDTRTVPIEYLDGLGIHRTSRGDAIRAYCVQICMCGSTKAVLECVSTACPLWPFKMGNDPWRAQRDMSEDQRQAAADRLAAARRSAQGVREADAAED